MLRNLSNVTNARCFMSRFGTSNDLNMQKAVTITSHVFAKGKKNVFYVHTMKMLSSRPIKKSLFENHFSLCNLTIKELNERLLYCAMFNRLKEKQKDLMLSEIIFNPKCCKIRNKKSL